MWPDGKMSITEVTKRPLTAATLFKNSIIALVDKLACKVRNDCKCHIMTPKKNIQTLKPHLNMDKCHCIKSNVKPGGICTQMLLFSKLISLSEPLLQ